MVLIDFYIKFYGFGWFLWIFVSIYMVLDGFYGFLYHSIWFWTVFNDFYAFLNHFLRKNHENGPNSSKIHENLCGSIPGPKRNIF